MFCLYLWDPLNRDASDCVLGLFGKLLRRRGVYWLGFIRLELLQIVFLVSLESSWGGGGCIGLVSYVWNCGVKVVEYWMISSLKIKLNHSWNFRRNWNVTLVLLERSWWAGFNGIYLIRFGFRMVGDIDFKVIFVAESSNKFQKTRFWKEKSVEDVVTLGPKAEATLINMKLEIEKGKRLLITNPLDKSFYLLNQAQ